VTTLVFVGSSGTVSAPISAVWHQTRFPEGGRIFCRSASSLPTPLCVRSSRSLRFPTRLRVGSVSSVWTSSLGVFKGSQSRPPVLPLGSQDRRRSVPWVQGRVPGSAPERSPGSRLRVPFASLWPPHVGFAPPSTSAPCSRLPGIEVATSSSELAPPCCTPEGECAAEPFRRNRCHSARAGVPSSSSLTTSTVSPHLASLSSPRPRASGSPRLRVLPFARLCSRSQALTCSRRRFQSTSPRPTSPQRPGGHWFV